jgi:hypothetical protein
MSRKMIPVEESFAAWLKDSEYEKADLAGIAQQLMNYFLRHAELIGDLLQVGRLAPLPVRQDRLRGGFTTTTS